MCVVTMNARAARDLSRIAAMVNEKHPMIDDRAFVLLIAVGAAGVVVVSHMVAGVDFVSVVTPGYFFED